MIKKYLPRHLPKLGCKGKLGSANVFFHVTNGDAPSNVNACCISSCTLSNRSTCLQDPLWLELKILSNFFACSSKMVVRCPSWDFCISKALWPIFRT